MECSLLRILLTDPFSLYFVQELGHNLFGFLPHPLEVFQREFLVYLMQLDFCFLCHSPLSSTYWLLCFEKFRKGHIQHQQSWSCELTLGSYFGWGFGRVVPSLVASKVWKSHQGGRSSEVMFVHGLEAVSGTTMWSCFIGPRPSIISGFGETCKHAVMLPALHGVKVTHTSSRVCVSVKRIFNCSHSASFGPNSGKPVGCSEVWSCATSEKIDIYRWHLSFN